MPSRQQMFLLTSRGINLVNRSIGIGCHGLQMLQHVSVCYAECVIQINVSLHTDTFHLIPIQLFGSLSGQLISDKAYLRFQ